MDQDELLIHEYKVCHDGYSSRDGLVPTEFSQMLRCFLILVAIATTMQILINEHERVGGVLFLLITIVGFCCLFAFAVNIQSKATAKRALRIRMVDIEKYFKNKELELNYWKSVVLRDKSIIESLYKHKNDERNESGSASEFFVVSSWILVIVWVLLEGIMYFGNIKLPSIG